MVIRTIDLWTEQCDNQYECFNGAFVDGFENNNIPFDRYKIVKNCNCIIYVDNDKINIQNKHNAIVFYKGTQPVRLMVINKNTDIDKCINTALSQYFKNFNLRDLYDKLNITFSVVDMNESPIDNGVNCGKEIDVGSCDRWQLLFNMLKGSYTEDNTSYGNYSNDKYIFLPNININYHLITDNEEFKINHSCAFINEIESRIIPIQDNSPLTN